MNRVDKYTNFKYAKFKLNIPKPEIFKYSETQKVPAAQSHVQIAVERPWDEPYLNLEYLNLEYLNI